MDLDEFDFGLPEGPASQLDQDPAVSPYSDVGMMSDFDSPDYNPFSNLSAMPSMEAMDSVNPGTAPPPTSASSMPMADLGSLGFARPTAFGTQSTAPGFITEDPGIGLSNRMQGIALFVSFIMLVMLIATVALYFWAVIKMYDIRDDVNSLRLIVNGVW